MSEATSPQLAVNHRPKRSKRFADLIISSSFEFENRWAFTDEIVDYDAIERWSDRRLQMNNSNLKRIKLYGLSAKSITGLLRNLCENENRSQLEHLEIDKLEIVQGNKFHPDHVFNDLKVLSINSTKIVDDRGEEAPGCLGVLAFNAPSLSTVYLGAHHNHSKVSIRNAPIYRLQLTLSVISSNEQAQTRSISSNSLAIRVSPPWASGSAATLRPTYCNTRTSRRCSATNCKNAT